MLAKIPGVYLEERKDLSKTLSSRVSATPLFMGYVEYAQDEAGNNLKGRPVLVNSFSEFQQYFGQDYVPQKIQIELEKESGAVKYIRPYQNDFGVSAYYLWKSVKGFFENGGQACYVLSVGYFNTEFSEDDFLKQMDVLRKIESPLIIATPDVVWMGQDDSSKVQKAILDFCSKNKKDFYILDIPDGDKPFSGVLKEYNPILNFRTSLGTGALNYGAVYYPWILYNYPVKSGLQNWEIIDADGNELNLSDYFLNHRSDSVKVLKKAASDMAAIFSKRTDAEVTEENYPQIFQQFLSKIDLLNNVENSEWHEARIYFNHLVKFVVETVWMLLRLDKDLSVSSSLRNHLTLLKTDTNLQKQIKKLVGFVNMVLEEKLVLFSYQNFYLDFKNDLKQTIWVGGLKDLNQLYDESAYEGVLITEIRKSVAHSQVLYQAFDALADAFVGFVKTVEEETQSSLSAWLSQEEIYQQVYSLVQNELNLCPPSGAVAGVYAATDNSRGAWKTPARVSLNAVSGISQKITDLELESLYVDTTGKSVNGLCTIPGQGVVIWGARTLDGNSNDWRYVNVRRYFSLIEESTKRLCRRFVFESNDAGTWIYLKGIIYSFLYKEWKQGAMSGSKPDEAFFIRIGLGESMTAEDILEGRMIVNVGLAVARPAEFIIIKITQHLQEN